MYHSEIAYSIGRNNIFKSPRIGQNLIQQNRVEDRVRVRQQSFSSRSLHVFPFSKPVEMFSEFIY